LQPNIKVFENVIYRDSQNMHGKTQNMRIYMHRKSPKYALKYAKFPKICTKYASKKWRKYALKFNILSKNTNLAYNFAFLEHIII